MNLIKDGFVSFDSARRLNSCYAEKRRIDFVMYPELFTCKDIFLERYADKMKIYVPFCKMLSKLDDIYESYNTVKDEDSRYLYNHDMNIQLRICFEQLNLYHDLRIFSEDAYERICYFLKTLDALVEDWIYSFNSELWGELRFLSGRYEFDGVAITPEMKNKIRVLSFFSDLSFTEFVRFSIQENIRYHEKLMYDKGYVFSEDFKGIIPIAKKEKGDKSDAF